jgi:hypothetical protein
MGDEVGGSGEIYLTIILFVYLQNLENVWHIDAKNVCIF